MIKKSSRGITIEIVIWLVLGGITIWADVDLEEPIRLAHPDENGIYEFEMIVEKRLTMARNMDRYNSYGDAVLDYDPNTRSYTQRERDVFTKCQNNATILRAEDSKPLKAEILDTVIQHHGKHVWLVTVNGKSPGETIVVPLGARVVLRVRNRLFAEAITVHVHGLDKKNAWFTDGVSFLQQCPIAPGSEHVYRFIADTPGTHWYHGHLMNDRADGLLGGFVVLTNRPHPGLLNLLIGRDYYTIFQDWSTGPSEEQWYCHRDATMKWVGNGFDDLHAIWSDYRNSNANETSNYGSTASRFCWAPTRTYDGSNVGGSVPLAALVIGARGWHDQRNLRERAGALPLSTFAIRVGENIRLRLVNGGVSQGFLVSVEDHRMLIVAADGANVVPREVYGLMIFPGERYDIVVRGMVALPPKPVYRILFETLEYYNWNWSRRRPQIGLANLRYEDVPESVEFDEHYDLAHSACTVANPCQVLNCNFERFPAQFNFTCVPAHHLESAEPVLDEELLEQKHFGDGFREIFANMNFDNHFDGWIYQSPRGMPYFYSDYETQESVEEFLDVDAMRSGARPPSRPRLERVARACDATRCDRHAGAHWDRDCFCFVHYRFRFGEIVQITIYNMGDKGTMGDGYSHPLHVHGTHFYLLRVGFARYAPQNATIRAMNEDIPCYDDTQRCIDLHWANLTWMNGNLPAIPKRPSFRDTVNIPTGGYVTIRFRASNPGWWFAHCHFLLHHMGGTAFAFRVGAQAQIPPPPHDLPHACGVYEQQPLPSLRQVSASLSRCSTTRAIWAAIFAVFFCSIFVLKRF